MEKIIGIYDANSGFKGEFKYIFEKIFYKKHCSLCDITHGSFKEKKEWIEKKDKFPIPVETMHINELEEKLAVFVENKTPCVVLKKGEEYKLLMTKEELKICDKDPQKFFEILEKKYKK